MLRVELVEERQAFGNGDCETFDWFRVTHLGQYNNDLYDIVIDMTFPKDCAGCAGGLGGRVWGSAGVPLAVTGKTVQVRIPHIARGFTEEIRVPRCAINRMCNNNRNGVKVKIRVSVPPPSSNVAAVTPLRARTLPMCRQAVRLAGRRNHQAFVAVNVRR